MVKMESVVVGVFLVALLGLGSVLVTAMATSKGNDDEVSYVSSLQVDDSKEVSDAQEPAQLAAIAKISADDAKMIALKAVDTNKVGAITDVALENEDGNVVYTVEFTKGNEQTDVQIDAGNGNVLAVEPGFVDSDPQDSTDEAD